MYNICPSVPYIPTFPAAIASGTVSRFELRIWGQAHACHIARLYTQRENRAIRLHTYTLQIYTTLNFHYVDRGHTKYYIYY